jgi:hypothetical protein
MKTPLRAFIEKLLIKGGYNVIVAADGQEAIQKSSDYTGEIDLLLLVAGGEDHDRNTDITQRRHPVTLPRALCGKGMSYLGMNFGRVVFSTDFAFLADTGNRFGGTLSSSTTGIFGLNVSDCASIDRPVV